jgi:hypothetical protein
MGNQLSAPVNVLLSSAYGHRVAWTGSEYGIGWIHAGKAWFVRASAAGALLGTPLQLGYASGNGDPPELSVVWSGNEYAVAWEGSSEIYFTRVSADGTKVIPEVIVGPSEGNGGPDMVWGKGEYVAAWPAPGAMAGQGYRVLARRIAENGTLVGNEIEVKNLGMLMSPIRILPHVDIAYNGTSYAVGWVSNEIEPKGYEVYVARLDASPKKIGNDIQVTSIGARDQFNYFETGNYPRLVWNGEEYAITWHDLIGQPTAWNAYMRNVCY